MISQSTIDRIFDTAVIEEVIGEFVPLKKSGSNYKGLSPWTNEKTPSFFVSPSKGIFKDFSSGKGGNVVSFLMELESMTYPEALKFLAEKYQIEVEETGVTPEELQERNVRESLALVNEFALEHFRHNLWETDSGKAVGLSYFRERGYTDQTIEKFALGYARDESGALLKAAEEAGHKREFLETVGLVKDGKFGAYDFFRGRVIFPIRNISGRCTAFAGRTLKSQDKIKYINSPENELYDKSRTLYGLFESKKGMTQSDMCYLVEGYTDVISLHQAGVDNVVASSGTSLTPGQAKLIKRYSKNATILYDGDTAGINAAMRGIDILLDEGLNVRVVLFPEGHDPDSYSRSVSQSELSEYLKTEARDFVDFILDVLLMDANDDPIAKSEATRRVLESLSHIDDHIARNFYIEKCSKRLGIPDRALVSELNKILRREQIRRSRASAPAMPEAEPEKTSTQDRAVVIDPAVYEREVTRVLLKYGHCEFDIEMEVDPPADENHDEAMDEADSTPEEPPTETVTLNVAEYIIHDLEADDIRMTSEVCAAIVDEYRRYREEHGGVPDPMAFTRDPELNVAVADMITDPYELSENWAERHHIYTEGEADDLRRTVFDPLMRFKLRKVKEMMAKTEEALKIETDPETVDNLLREKMVLDRMKSEVCAFFGTTIL